jgi:3-oxoisoapionate decarboxylase
MDRREFLMSGVAAGLVGAMSNDLLAQQLPPISQVGVATAGMGFNRDRMGNDPIAFIEYCRSLGAGGVQMAVSGDVLKLRRRLDELGMWFEGNASPPATLDESTDRFEQSLRDTLTMGGNVVRYVSRMPRPGTGRRYSTFTSRAAYQEWIKEANAIVMKCLPIAERMGVKIALENHKDRAVEEHVEVLSKASSEYLGALVDPGNNISFLERPEHTCSMLAPYVLMASMKEMGVAQYEEGLLLSEVPMGQGFTDQLALWKILTSRNKNLRFGVEMIARNPLKVPCLTQGYWASMNERSAEYLGSFMQWVRENATELPYVDDMAPADQLRVEEEWNRAAIEWGRANIS